MAFLGIDAGASATKWAVLEGETVIASGRQSAMDAHLYREESLLRLREVIREISDASAGIRIEGILMGITGFSVEADFQSNFKEVFTAPVTVISDVELAYRANFADTEGVLIYAGTGSVAFTQDKNGRALRIGGWGYLLGDEGAGYWIGREGVRAAMYYIDSEQLPKANSLEAQILAAISATNWAEVKSFVYGKDRNAMAALSRVVAECAESGDITAKNIIKAAARHLADLVHRTEEVTGQDDLAVKFAGGIAQISEVANELQSLLGNRCTIATADIAKEAARLAATQA